MATPKPNAWNPNTTTVYSTRGSAKEIPISQYDTFINSGWKPSSPVANSSTVGTNSTVLPKVGDLIPGTNLKYEAADIANLQNDTSQQENFNGVSNFNVTNPSTMKDVIGDMAGVQSLQRAGVVSGGFTDTNKVYLYDSVEKTYRPIDNPEALMNLLGLDPKDPNSLNKAFDQVNVLTAEDLKSPLWKGTLISKVDSIKSDGSIPEASTKVEGGTVGPSILDHYGATPNEAMHAEIVNSVGAFFKTISGAKAMNDATFNKYINNPQNVEVLSKYADALLYGGYTFNDIYRDLKAKELFEAGDQRYKNFKGFDESVSADKWRLTDEGKKASEDPTLAPPQGFAGIDESVWNNTIFKISDEAFKTLIPVIDVNSQEFKDEAEKVKAQYYDVLLQKSEANTEQAKALSDDNWKIFKEDLEKKYKIQLSDNATTAWGQIEDIFSGASSKGLANSGIMNEAIDSYLMSIRKGDQRARDNKQTEKEQKDRERIIKTGTPEEIAALSEETRIAWGLMPKAGETDGWDPQTKEIMLDKNGNYRSGLFQDQFANQYNIGEQKRAYQEQKLLQQKLDDEKKAYAPYTGGNTLSSWQTTLFPNGTKPNGTSDGTVHKPGDKWTAPDGLNTNEMMPDGTIITTALNVIGKTEMLKPAQKEYVKGTDSIDSTAKVSENQDQTQNGTVSVPKPNAWNPNTTTVYSTSGSAKEIPISQYDTFINSGWKSSSSVSAPNPVIIPPVIPAKVEVPKSLVSSPNSVVPAYKERNYVIKAGDTLSGIAKSQLGNSNLYKDIASWNNIVDPNKIKAGATIKIRY